MNLHLLVSVDFTSSCFLAVESEVKQQFSSEDIL